jgi:tRNA-2-methylthio-N6-dimethylallyladenosine synthase
MKYHIKTFGCQQNTADSERIAQSYEARGMSAAETFEDTNFAIINTCMIRSSAEHRVYGLVHNLKKIKEEKAQRQELFKIIVTGCMVGMAFRDKSGKYLERLRTVMPDVDEFMPIEEVGFDHEPVRQNATRAWVPISNGCNNFCTFCVVPFTRGREISRSYGEIIEECKRLKARGFTHITLLGQNVNSYGADLIMGKENVQVLRDTKQTYFPTDQANGSTATVMRPQSLSTLRTKLTYNGHTVEPIYVKHLGKHRIPTLFPYLLEDVASIEFQQVDFISSNPWDFSDELIEVIAQNENITRTIHLPVQSGDNTVLKRMNRWYTSEEYLMIIKKLKKKVQNVKFTTDIIVGFCGETDEEFQSTFALAKEVGYEKAYISMYSERPMTAATRFFKDDVSHETKKSRWLSLELLINGRHHQPQ